MAAQGQDHDHLTNLWSQQGFSKTKGTHVNDPCPIGSVLLERLPPGFYISCRNLAELAYVIGVSDLYTLAELQVGFEHLSCEGLVELGRPSVRGSDEPGWSVARLDVNGPHGKEAVQTIFTMSGRARTSTWRNIWEARFSELLTEQHLVVMVRQFVLDGAVTLAEQENGTVSIGMPGARR